VRDEVRVGHRQRVREQRHRVVPQLDLRARAHHAQRERERGQAGREPRREPSARARALHELGDRERRDQRDPDERQVGVAIREGLHAHLHDAERRHQEADEPEPADDPPRPPPRLPQREGADRDDHERRDGERTPVDPDPVRVQHRERGRPDREAEVRRDALQRVREPARERNRLDARRLRRERDQAGAS
jgi:hypothetical protein